MGQADNTLAAVVQGETVWVVQAAVPWARIAVGQLGEGRQEEDVGLLVAVDERWVVR
jgi:hypothetical protein